jgi:ABC-type branched-subunit amino acid transport system permease subunit
MFSIWGGLLGAGILVLIPELLRFLPHELDSFLKPLVASAAISDRVAKILIDFSQNSMLIFSLLVLLILKINPDGLEYLVQRIRKRFHGDTPQH